MRSLMAFSAGLFLFLYGCASTTPSSSADASPGGGPPSPSPSSPSAEPASNPPPDHPPSGGTTVRELTAEPVPLPAGTYTRAAFRPAVTLDVDGSWTSVNRFDDFFDVEQDVGSPDVIAVQVAQPTGIFGADGRAEPVELPREAAAVLSEASGLSVVEQSDSRIGGLEGRQITIENTSGQFAAVLTVSPGTLSIDTGRRLWIAFFATPDGLVAVMVGGSIAKWDDALTTAEPVLESIRFAGSASPIPESPAP